MGTPNLYTLAHGVRGQRHESAITRTRNSASARSHRSLNSVGGRAFHINGKKILIRGGGWSPDMMLRENSQRLHDEFRYVQDMGLNTIRLEGKLETEEFFELADQQGDPGHGGLVLLRSLGALAASGSRQTSKSRKQSLRDQMYRLRSHPSLVMWLNGSDNPPPPDVEQMYLDIEKELLWPNPVVSSATGKTDQRHRGQRREDERALRIRRALLLAGGHAPRASRAQACNPGGCGGAYGFNTETSLGPAVPPIESMRDDGCQGPLWPIDDFWNYHAGGGEFKDIHVFTRGARRALWQGGQRWRTYALKSQTA